MASASGSRAFAASQGDSAYTTSSRSKAIAAAKLKTIGLQKQQNKKRKNILLLATRIAEGREYEGIEEELDEVVFDVLLFMITFEAFGALYLTLLCPSLRLSKVSVR